MDSQILEILVKHKLAPSIELLTAMRDVYNAGAATAKPSTPGGDEDDGPAVLSVSDIAALKRLGIDPNKKMRQRNSVFTVTGYRPSRWKFPISVQTQQGARYKMTVAQVVNLQNNS